MMSEHDWRTLVACVLRGALLDVGFSRAGSIRRGPMERHEFNQDQVDAAIDYVSANGAQDRASTISYSRVFAEGSLPPPQLLHQSQEPHLVSKFMEAFHYRCIEREMPPLDALVVHVAAERKDFPGTGYFRVNGYDDPLNERTKPERVIAATRFWEQQKAECERWGTMERRGHN